jgi:hypothetical protein
MAVFRSGHAAVIIDRLERAAEYCWRYNGSVGAMNRLLGLIWLALITPCFGQLDCMLKPTDKIQIRASQNPKVDGHIFQIQADGFVTYPLSVAYTQAAQTFMPSRKASPIACDEILWKSASWPSILQKQPRNHDRQDQPGLAHYQATACYPFRMGRSSDTLSACQSRPAPYRQTSWRSTKNW